MGKTKIMIHLEGEGKINIEIEIYKFFTEIRRDLLDIIKFPFIFVLCVKLIHLQKNN